MSEKGKHHDKLFAITLTDPKDGGEDWVGAEIFPEVASPLLFGSPSQAAEYVCKLANDAGRPRDSFNIVEFNRNDGGDE